MLAQDRILIDRLKNVDWDFSSAQTDYLTHNIHPYPAKFIPQIPSTLIRELSTEGEVVADIFAGSGTTLLEALRLGRHAVGIDANPLATLIARAKTTQLNDHDIDDIQSHWAYCSQTLEVCVTKGIQEISPNRWRPDEELCEFWFKPQVVEELSALRSLIADIPSRKARLLCEVAFSAIIVRVSNQDSDTRYVRREKRSRPGDTIRRYLRQLDNTLQAVSNLSSAISDSFSCQVINANLLASPETPMFDLVVSSPPYPNAYSYHLYHRTRLAWLGYDPEEFKKIEMGSHRKYSAKGKDRATPETFRREFEAIFLWLQPKLRDRGYVCLVLGNSKINGQEVDNATLLSWSAEMLGFHEVARIERVIPSSRKSFNPKIGRIKTENILILQKA